MNSLPTQAEKTKNTVTMAARITVLSLDNSQDVLFSRSLFL